MCCSLKWDGLWCLARCCGSFVFGDRYDEPEYFCSEASAAGISLSSCHQRTGAREDPQSLGMTLHYRTLILEILENFLHLPFLLLQVVPTARNPMSQSTLPLLSQRGPTTTGCNEVLSRHERAQRPEFFFHSLTSGGDLGGSSDRLEIVRP